MTTTTTKHEQVAEQAEKIRQHFWGITVLYEALEVLTDDDDFMITMAVVDLQNATREMYKAYGKLTTEALRIKESTD